MAPSGPRQLIVWQRAMDLMVEAYRLSRRLPHEERYVVVPQLRRAAWSVPLNISEGNGRLHRGDYVHHLSMARASLMEVETVLEGILRLEYITADDMIVARDLIDQIGRMLTAMICRLRKRKDGL